MSRALAFQYPDDSIPPDVPFIWLTPECDIKRVCFKFRPHHFGDGDHCCRGRHGGVGAVEKLTTSASHCKTIDVVDKDVVN